MTRQQHTLFVDDKDKSAIERIRATFNPSQQQLIESHLTLCREDENQSTARVRNFSNKSII